MLYLALIVCLCGSVNAFLSSANLLECKERRVKGFHHRHLGDNTFSSKKLLHGQHSKIERMVLPPDSGDPLVVSGLDPTLTIVLVAGGLGLLSQSLINSMLKGDQGLSAFLSDGSGFQNSSFRQRRKSDNDNAPLGGEDPLPWLKLPKLSYVEVAGQENEVAEEIVVARLEELAMEMRLKLEAGDKERATEIMQEMNELMEQYGFDYKPN